MFSSKFFSSESHTKTANNHGSFEYLVSYARRLLESANGSIEIRDADGVLYANLYTDGNEIVEWISPSI